MPNKGFKVITLKKELIDDIDSIKKSSEKLNKRSKIISRGIELVKKEMKQ